MKKLVLSMLLMLLSVSVFASSTMSIPTTAVGLYQITKLDSVAVHTSVMPCPSGAVCEAVSVVTVSVTMNGCVDTLGPVTYSTESLPDGRLHVVASVLGFADSRSPGARCFAPNRKQFSINLGFGYMTEKNVVVELLNSSILMK